MLKSIDSGLRDMKFESRATPCVLIREDTAVASLLTNTFLARSPTEAIATSSSYNNIYKPCLCFLRRHSVTSLSISWWMTRQNAVRSKLIQSPRDPYTLHVVYTLFPLPLHLHALIRCLLTHAEHTTATDRLSPSASSSYAN